LEATLVKIDALPLVAKRLEEGTYAMPFGEEQEHRLEITAQELGALLSGIDLSVAKRRKRYRRKSTEAA
jgi:IS66 Orf2 like protein